MPYMIYVPGIPRPYITNDPRIYMDCDNLFGWRCESRRFSDSYCKEARVDEDLHNEGDRRREQLEQYWTAELDMRKRLKQKTETAQMGAREKVGDLAPAEQSVTITSTTTFGKHDKCDSLLSVFIEVKENLTEDIEAGTNEVPAPWISLKYLAGQCEFSLEMARALARNCATI